MNCFKHTSSIKFVHFHHCGYHWILIPSKEKNRFLGGSPYNYIFAKIKRGSLFEKGLRFSIHIFDFDNKCNIQGGDTYSNWFESLNLLLICITLSGCLFLIIIIFYLCLLAVHILVHNSSNFFITIYYQTSTNNLSAIDKVKVQSPICSILLFH